MAARRLTGDRLTSLIDEYQAGNSSQVLGTRYGLSSSGVLKILRREGVTIRPRRTYTLRNDFFRTIDTPEKAYALGWIVTDGNVSRDGCVIRIALQSRDRCVLEYLATILGSNRPLKEHRAAKPKGGVGEYVTLSFGSVEMVSDLACLGVGPAKSHTVKPWTGSPDLEAAFWAGAFEGDGSLIYRKHSNLWFMAFTGNTFMVAGFRDFVRRVAVGYEMRVYPHHKSWQTTITSIPVQQAVLREMHAHAPYLLPRKKLQADIVLAWERSRKDWSDITAEHLATLKIRLHTWVAVSQHLGMPTGSNARQLAVRLGVLPSRPKARRYANISDETLAALFAEHGSWKYVADALGMKLSALHTLRYHRRNGQSRPRKPR